MWYNSLLDVENPTDGQLIYMRDMFKEKTLIEYMVRRWEKKFNTHMTEKEYKKI